MFCPSCGNANDDSASFCSSCGQALNRQPRVVVQDGGLSVLIPRNTDAIWAYYLGIASLLFCILPGIPAIILGIRALNKAKKTPALKGEVHAWVGIILGGLSLFVFLLFIVLIIVGNLS